MHDSNSMGLGTQECCVWFASHLQQIQYQGHNLWQPVEGPQTSTLDNSHVTAKILHLFCKGGEGHRGQAPCPPGSTTHVASVATYNLRGLGRNTRFEFFPMSNKPAAAAGTHTPDNDNRSSHLEVSLMNVALSPGSRDLLRRSICQRHNPVTGTTVRRRRMQARVQACPRGPRHRRNQTPAESDTGGFTLSMVDTGSDENGDQWIKVPRQRNP